MGVAPPANDVARALLDCAAVVLACRDRSRISFDSVDGIGRRGLPVVVLSPGYDGAAGRSWIRSPDENQAEECLGAWWRAHSMSWMGS